MNNKEIGAKFKTFTAMKYAEQAQAYVFLLDLVAKFQNAFFYHRFLRLNDLTVY